MSFFRGIIDSLIPVLKADDEEEELVDPQKILREECGQQQKCVNLREKLDTCNDRVNSRSNTEETCLEEILDYVQCVDHCVAKTLFTKLK